MSEDQPAWVSLDLLPHPVAVCDEGGTVLYANAAWRDEAAHSQCELLLARDIRSFVLARREDQPAADLARALEEVLAGTRGGFDTSFPCLVRAARSCRLRAAARTLDGRRFLVLLHEDATEQRRNEEQLRERAAQLEERLDRIATVLKDSGFGGPAPHRRVSRELRERVATLTRREAEIVRHLLSGRRVAAVARERGVSVHTVRNHLRAAFKKLQVHSQEELLETVPQSAFEPPRA